MMRTMELRFVRRYIEVSLPGPANAVQLHTRMILQQKWVSVGRGDEERREEWRDVEVRDATE